MMKSLLKPSSDEWSNDSFAVSNPSGENMNRFQANDLRNLITEVVSAFKAEKRNKWLLESPEVIEEGVFDPGILKAIFTAGGPGSGKSFVADMLMGARSLEPPNHERYFEKNTSYLHSQTGLHAWEDHAPLTRNESTIQNFVYGKKSD